MKDRNLALALGSHRLISNQQWDNLLFYVSSLLLVSVSKKYAFKVVKARYAR
jgi:hypothetical protein